MSSNPREDALTLAFALQNSTQAYARSLNVPAGVVKLRLEEERSTSRRRSRSIWSSSSDLTSLSGMVLGPKPRLHILNPPCCW